MEGNTQAGGLKKGGNKHHLKKNKNKIKLDNQLCGWGEKNIIQPKKKKEQTSWKGGFWGASCRVYCHLKDFTE